MDACARKVKASVKVWPSARASQMVAKCRKHSGHVRKGASGTSLRRWQREKWKDTLTNKPCGHPGKRREYCRPSHRVSSKTPTHYRGAKLRKMQGLKTRGFRAVAPSSKRKARK